MLVTSHSPLVLTLAAICTLATAYSAAAQPTLKRLDAVAADGTVSVPLTNGRGIVTTDVPVTVHTENGTLYAVRWTDPPDKHAIATGVGGTTVAARGEQVLVAYVALREEAIHARVSADGGVTWSEPASLGPRPAGPALPTACLYASDGALRQVVAWSAQPSESDGPLVVAQHDGRDWQRTEHPSIRSSGPALQCADDAPPEIVWRDHRDGLGPRVALYHAFIDPDGGLPGEHRVLMPAFDPSVCATPDARYVGYHGATNDAHLARSRDGGVTYADVDLDPGTPALDLLDDSGKFVSVACDGPVVAATWGDWPTKSDAAGRTPTRMLGMRVSTDGGQSWISLRPAGDDQDQGPATVAVAGERVLVMWKAPGTIRLAEFTLAPDPATAGQ